MCGIVGYIGERDSATVLVDGLRKLEYRGYDSAGIAVFEDGVIKMVKSKGRLDDVENKMKEVGRPNGHCGIGHTRWATHGEPSDANSHPHGTDKVTIVHNGIIENYLELKDMLIGKGYSFKSETDTETVSNLLDLLYNGDPLATIQEALKMIEGSYALGIMFKDVPDKIFAVRKDSPLIVGLGDKENFIASDIPAILKYTNRYYLLEENELVVVTADKVDVFDCNLNPIKKTVLEATWDVEAAEKGGYPHFMIKEINEEPKAINNTIHPRIVNGLPDLGIPELTDDALKNISKIHIVACGTAMHAGMIGKACIEQLARIPVDVDIASEFRYRNPILSKNDLVIIISQSGETADTLAALRLAKGQGVKTMAVVNVVGSSIAREADWSVFTWAGPEIAVASTKAYSVQISVMYLLAIKLGLVCGGIDEERAAELTASLVKMPEIVESVIRKGECCKDLAEQFKDVEDLFFIGRGLDYYLSMEGSLKLKEISYVHSEAYAAAELKHGTISLITDGIPVIAIATQAPLYSKMIGNIKEVKARGANVILLCREGAPEAEKIADHIIDLPDIEDMFMPMAAVVILQMFAYYMSVARGCDVDKPRNLAKSVTVE